jgi:hypothetical protein
MGLFLEGFVQIFVGPSDIGTRYSETTSHLQTDSSTTDANLIRWQRLAIRQLRERKGDVDSGKDRHNFGVKTSVCKCWAGITTIGWYKWYFDTIRQVLKLADTVYFTD